MSGKQRIDEVKKQDNSPQDISEIKKTSKLVEVDCPRCSGKGTVPHAMHNQEVVCPRCGGSKKIRVPEGQA